MIFLKFLRILNRDLGGGNIANLNYGPDVKLKSSYYTEDTLNAPDNSGGNVITSGNGNNRISQLALSMSGVAYIRRCYNSEWINWSRLVSNSDYLDIPAIKIPAGQQVITPTNLIYKEGICPLPMPPVGMEYIWI